MGIEQLIEGLKAHEGQSVLLDVKGSIDLFKQDIGELEVYEDVVLEEGRKNKYLVINNINCENWEGISVKENDIESVKGMEDGENVKDVKQRNGNELNGMNYYIKMGKLGIHLYQEM